MTGYYLYFMDRFSGHIEHRRDFVADGDAEALEIAHGWHDGNPMELWLGSHKLKRWEALSPASLATAGATSAGE